jgi:DNA-binding transcriptional ArsR family regulator
VRSNATSESLNRLAKLEARLAYGFRNPLNQRRRVRIACTRGYRRRSRTATPKRTHSVTGRQPDPGYRICFRVREPRDVDLVLGQGMLRAGWDAHNLNAPGKFLVSAPGHDRPKRARAYLLTDQVVTETAARYAAFRPPLDAESRRAILAAANTRPIRDGEPPDDGDSPEAGRAPTMAEQALWMALCRAPLEGIGVSDLISATGMTRSTIYRHLRELARNGHVVQVSRGRWRARTTEEPSP